MKRDPRMVERKKTGLAKARKRVSHLCSTHSSRFSLRYFSTPGLSGDIRLFVSFAHGIYPLPISVIMPSVENGGFMRESLAHNEKNDNV